MRIRITADSTCDLSAELRERYNIALFPMTVIRNGEAFKDGVDIFEKDLYEYFEKTGKLCSTALFKIYPYEITNIIRSCN